MSIWRIYFLTSTWGNRFLEESSYCIMIAKTKSTSMLELGFWQWPHTTLTLNNPFFQPLSFLFHLMCKMVVWLAVGTTNTLVKLKNRPALVYPSHKVRQGGKGKYGCSAPSWVNFRLAESVPPRPGSISGRKSVFCHVPGWFSVSRVCSATSQVDFRLAECVPPRPESISGQ